MDTLILRVNSQWLVVEVPTDFSDKPNLIQKIYRRQTKKSFRIFAGYW